MIMIVMIRVRKKKITEITAKEKGKEDVPPPPALGLATKGRKDDEFCVWNR